MERKEKEDRRRRRHKRIRKTIFGTAQRPRLCVYKSLKHIYAQLVDDESQKVITGVSTLTPAIRSQIKN
ncbi:MAG: 50S ribosomal protein L18, partial [Deltaproteobacteria bacterium]|nr:50S ribosomal protein L18 [Deltaproteobacteria bacterium]